MTDGSSLPSAPSFRIRKIGHVVLRARDLGNGAGPTRLKRRSPTHPPGQTPVLQDPSLLQPKA